jgi:serine/threonine-protein kinase
VVSVADGSLTDLGLRGAEPHYVTPGYVLFNRGSVVMAAPFSLRKRAFTGPPVRVLEDVAGVNAATADFAVSQNGWLAYQGGGVSTSSSLWVVDLHGVGRPLDTEGKHVSSPVVSPDGKHIALGVRESRSNDIWTLDLASGALRPFAVGGNNGGPSWSRDGSRIYYRKDPGSSLMARASDGAGAESTVVASFADASVSGGFVPGPAHGYSVFRAGPGALVIAPTDSLTATRPFVKAAATVAVPAISPNGRWVAYMTDASGRAEVVVRALPGPGAEVPVSVGGGEHPRWAPDGKTLYYRGPRHMMAARITEQPQFAVSKRDTLFIDTFARGPGNEFSVFPNGNQLLMVQRGQAKAELFMVINWQQLIGLPGSGTERASTPP